MKKILFVLLFIFQSNCKTVHFYHGYVLNAQYEPLIHVSVEEDNNFPSSTVTDSSGYFKLSKSSDLVSKLIFNAEGYNIDTVNTVWNRYDGSGKRFLNKEPDTIILRRLLVRNYNDK